MTADGQGKLSQSFQFGAEHFGGCLKMFNWRQDAAATRRQDACAMPAGSAGVLACGFTELPSSVFLTGIFRQSWP